MICPNCQNDNRAGARFCDNCGQRLALTCANCGAANRLETKFCDNCGQALSDSAGRPGKRPSPVQSLIPRALAAKLEAARGSGIMEGERRIVTMLFCDVKGSTAAAERLDPEEWTEIINGAFEQMIRPVYRYEGTVARLMGDGILAFFGAPIAHEDDPQRGVMAGLDIIAAINGYAEQVLDDWLIDLKVRVGINTGLVVVGAVGSDLRMEYTAIGDAINLAARMEQTAEPGTINVAEDTYKLVSHLFEFEALGEMEIKGKQAPVRVYRALRRKQRPRKAPGIEGLASTLVGRDQEMATLRDLVAKARHGQGQIVSIMGEAGLGKSRLIAELAEREAGPAVPVPVQWSELSGASYSSNRPYDAFQSQIRLRAGITPADAPDVARQKLHAFVKAVGQHIMEPGVYEHLLGLADGSRFDVEGEAFKHALFETVLSATRAEIDGRPSVIVFDDMHWADPATLELEMHLLQLSRELPVLFIFSFRPDRTVPVWETRSRLRDAYPERYTELELQPLDADDGTRLLDNLLDIPDMPQALRLMIRDRAEGNPFFVEEIVRSLLERGVVVRNGDGARWANGSGAAAIEIPENVQALLAARVDRLSDDVRRTLQLAAVIGRSFYRRVLEAIGEAPEHLGDHLQILERAEFIHEARRVPEREYVFRHALTQEAVYKTLLLKHRREFHRRVGQALEALFPERLEELSPLLAHHFDESRQWERAFHYHAMAGHAAYRLNAYLDAEKHYERAVALHRQAYGASDEVIELYRRRGRTLELLLAFEKAVANYEEMERIGQQDGNDQMILAGWIALATIKATFTPVRDTVEAIALSERALELARRLRDREAESMALWNLALGYGFGQDALKSVTYGEASLAIARELNLVRQIPVVINDLFRSYFFGGQIEKALASAAEAKQLLRDVGNLPILASNLLNMGVALVQLGQYDRALASLEEATALSRSIGNVGGEVGGGFAAGLVFIEKGEWDRAIRFSEQNIQLAERVGQFGELGFNCINLSWLYSSLRLLPQALSYAEMAMKWSVDIGSVHPYARIALARIRLLEGDSRAAKQFVLEAKQAITFNWFIYHPLAGLVEGEVSLAAGDFERAATRSETLLQKMVQYRARPWRPDVLLLRAKALRGAGKEDEAIGILKEAQAEAEALGSRRSLWQILALLAEMEDGRGDTAVAAAHWKAAAEQVQLIVGHMPNPSPEVDLRQAFLDLPQVQVVLAARPGVGDRPSQKEP
jgi:class 3 adenylate cyclase/tetratricopeptide (TPR) repeat protein